MLRAAWISSLVVIVAMVAPRPLAATPTPPRLSDDERSQLEAGEVLTRARVVQPHDATLARAMAVVDATPEQVWQHIDACEHFKEFVPRVVVSEVLSREGEEIRFRSKVDMPFPLPDIESELLCRHRAYEDAVYERRWKGTSGPLKVNEGSWRIFPWSKGHSLVVYTAHIAPKMKIPPKIRMMAQRITLPKTVKALRERVIQASAPRP